MTREWRRPLAGARAWVAAAAVAYVAVYVITSGLNSRPTRVLYDATGDVPVPYQWVRPPTDLSVDNVPATAAHAEVDPARGATVSTPDAQVVLTIPAGALRSGSDPGDAVSVDIEPLAPATLAAVGNGRAADGNAYLIRFAGLGTGAADNATAAPIDIALREPQYNLVDDVLFTSPGPRGPWRALAAVQSGPDAMVAATREAGYYVLGGRTMTSHLSLPRVGEVVGAGLGVLVILIVAIRRGRRSVARAGSG